MRSIALLLLLLSLSPVADAGKTIASFRLKKDPNAPMRGWIVDYDDAGFVFEFFGSGRKTDVSWSDLVKEDATRLRRGFKLELSEDERLGLMKGQRLVLVGGGQVEGLLLQAGGNDQYWLKVQGAVLPYPKDRVDHVEQIKLPESKVYDKQELYVRRLQRTPPQTPEQHRDLGDYLFEIGSFEKAQVEYEKAIALDSSFSAPLAARMAEIAEYRRNREAEEAFAKARYRAHLLNDFDGAMEILKNYAERHPDARRAAAKTLLSIQKYRMQKLAIRFQYVKHEELDRVVDHYVTSKHPGIHAAMSWVKTRLSELLEARIRCRMNISADDYDYFLAKKTWGSPHWATYWTGSFVVSDRAVKGKSTKHVIRGDPEAWWEYRTDFAKKRTFLEAYAAENLPKVFSVVSVRMEPCPMCGGKGYVVKMSVHSLRALGGGHEWKELCPCCFGAREVRSVGYR